MTLKKKIILFITFAFGILIPFVPELAVIEVFFLLIPLALAFLITLIILILNLREERQSRNNAVFTFSVIPIFILSQLFSELLVDKIQKVRCEKIIEEIQVENSQTGKLPENYVVSFGIDYKKLNIQEFELSYERGFMITETYNSEERKWKSYSWNN